MEPEVKQKKVKARGSITLVLKGIPRSAHKCIVRYQKTITGLRNKKYNIKQAYVEWIKETTSKDI